MRHPVFAVVVAILASACATDAPVAPKAQPQTQFDHATADGSVPDFFVADGALCVLKADHTIQCSGDLQNVAPAGSDFVEVAVSFFGTEVCGLHATGEVSCVGEQSYLNTPPAGPFTAISMNVDVACALRTDGTIACWGYQETYRADLPPSGTFSKIRGGWAGFCGIRTDQTLACWGDPPTLAVPTGTFTDISVGATNCGLRTDGSVVCFDINGTTSTPLAGTFTRIVSNDYGHVLNLCGQQADMTLSCVGPDFQPPATPVTALSAGVKTLCGTTQGQLACWGEDYRRNGKFSLTDAPAIVTGEPYRILQGQTASLDASGSTDPNGDPLTVAWDIGADGTVDATGAVATSPVLYRNTPFYVIVSDGISRIKRQGVIIVTDVPPTATFVAPARVTVGHTFTLQLTNVTDPSPADLAVAKGQFDCGTGSVTTLATGVFTITCTAPANPTTLNVRGSVFEPGIVGRPLARSPFYTASIVVSNNAPPQATLSAPASVPEGSAIALSLTNVVDENVATLTYAFDCGSGYGAYGSIPSASCPTTDDGTRAVRAKLRDEGGLETEYTASVAVTDVPPSVNSFAGATIMAGETYSAAGSFTGASVDQFTATVDYGAGAAPLALAGYSFSLSHQYATAGTYNVIVTVTDDDGSTSSSSASVVVQSAAQAAATLSNTINALVTSGTLSAGTANSMTSTLSNAASSYSSGNTTAGNNQIDAFINKVQAQINSGRLSAAQGQQLIDYANRIKASSH